MISRFSSTLIRDTKDKNEKAASLLGANYLLEGNFFVDGPKIMVSCSLIDLATQTIVWHDRFKAEISDLFQVESETGHRICEGACTSVLRVEVGNATTKPLPTMQSHSLMLGSIALMHRASKADFLRSRAMLDRLHELHRRHAQPLAWLGKWYVLQLAQGWSSDPERDATEALQYCKQALELDSHSSLALSITGQVHGYLRHDLDVAEQHYQEALRVNPNETLAWLWSGMNAGFRGMSEGAVASTERAMQLSPIDPLRYYYQSLAASTATCTEQYDKAIVLAKASIRVNRTHASTYRALAISQALSGREAEARVTAGQLLTLDPQSSVQRFIDRYPAANEAPQLMHKLAEGLRIAGLPD